MRDHKTDEFISAGIIAANALLVEPYASRATFSAVEQWGVVGLGVALFHGILALAHARSRGRAVDDRIVKLMHLLAQAGTIVAVAGILLPKMHLAALALLAALTVPPGLALLSVRRKQ